MNVTLAAGARAAMLAASHDEAPLEACGLLIGSRVAGNARVERVVRSPNRARAEDAFAIDPIEVVRVDAEARSADLELLGTWHSHPTGVAVPSRRDRACAGGGWLCAIVGQDDAIRVWRLVDGAFVEDDVRHGVR